MLIARAMCGTECDNRRFVFQEQSASLSICDQQLCKKLDDYCLWRDPRSLVLNSRKFICNSISLLVPNKLLYTLCGYYYKCIRPVQLPVLTEVELRPSWNNIHDTFHTGPPRIQHNHCCRGKTISITYSECVSVALAIEHVKRMRCIT